MMNLHYDDIIYNLQGFGGISVYWREITSRISADVNINAYRSSGYKLNRYFPVKSNADIFHSSYYRMTPNPKTKNVVTVHDFIYELGYVKTLGRWINIIHNKKVIHEADAIICVSENTKKDLLSFYPETSKNPHIYVIGHGTLYNTKKVDINCSNRLIALNQSTLNKYILFVGRRISYKNFTSVVLAFAKSELPKLGYSIVCTSSKFSETEKNLFNSLGIKNKVFVLDQATNNELKYLYQNALALVYPSLYEGFGIPPLEAMSCGCPVIASQISSIPEVVGDSGILIEPQDVDAISNALEVLLDKQVRKSYIQKGLERSKLFSWEQAANKHIQVYQNLLETL